MQVTLVDYSGSDLSTVNAARVSFDKESDWDMIEVLDDSEGPIPLFLEPRLKESDVKLINYLAKHKHLSPFNHSFISLRVKVPIFVARQLVKHEYMPWNEVSRRYVDSEPEFYFPDVWRKKADNVKQGSSNEAVRTLHDFASNSPTSIDSAARSVVQLALHLYEDMSKAGVCPEQARLVLPHNLMTECIWSGTLGAFAKMLGLRLDEHTQKETRDVAIMIRDIVEPLFPVSLKALLENK